ncbi:MAG TPA: hypothetical protein VIW78_04980 [Burkholderiales bacterium]
MTTPALPQSFTVPAATASGQTVEELVVEFVSGVALTRSYFDREGARPADKSIAAAIEQRMKSP